MGYIQQVRAFYKRNKTQILVALVSLLVGGSILGFNAWNYEQSTLLYSAGPQEMSAELRQITSDKPFIKQFPLQDHATLSDVTIEIRFEQVRPTSSFRISLNGEVIEQSAGGMNPGAVQELNPDTGILELRNRIEVEGTLRVAGEAVIDSIEVSGYSALQRYTFLFLNLLGILIIIGPIMAIRYTGFKERQELEDRFPDFLRDIVEGTRSGMSIPQAIKNTEENDYGALSKYVGSISARIEWGIPLEKVLQDFASRTKSHIIQRSVNTILQSYQSGGNVSDVLQTVGANLKQVKELHRKRESELYGQVVTGYIVYFIFLAIMVALIRYLVPALTFSGNIPSLGTNIGILSSAGGRGTESTVSLLRPLFRNLVIIQSIFSGLVIGKLSEGELRAGAKHVGILLAAGYIVSVLFM